jgi:pyridoxal phosphate enzyme (YggS family)
VNTSSTAIAHSISNVRDNIQRFEKAYGRRSGSVELLAVSKRKPVSAISEAIQAGQQLFGENYVDEGVEKISSLSRQSIQWHYIGAIQSRKTSMIAQHFDWAHGVDRAKIASRLSDQRPANLPPLNICLQVNLDNEPGKAGVELEQVPELAAHCATLSGICLKGLMAIPMQRTDFDQQRDVFSKLRRCQQALSEQFTTMTTLSMGMSGDMEAAIAEGSTLVRIGTAIFGARE